MTGKGSSVSTWACTVALPLLYWAIYWVNSFCIGIATTEGMNFGLQRFTGHSSGVVASILLVYPGLHCPGLSLDGVSTNSLGINCGQHKRPCFFNYVFSKPTSRSILNPIFQLNPIIVVLSEYLFHGLKLLRVIFH